MHGRVQHAFKPWQAQAQLEHCAPLEAASKSRMGPGMTIWTADMMNEELWHAGSGGGSATFPG